MPNLRYLFKGGGGEKGSGRINVDRLVYPGSGFTEGSVGQTGFKFLV